jgi:hypothetical protein
MKSPGHTGMVRCEGLEPRRLLTTYYVSNSGSDAANGTSPATAWQTVAKVDAAQFNPGDQILFQRGGQWREALAINGQRGSVGDPIIFGAYGDPSQPKPLLIGSNLLNDGAFVQYSGTTYSYSSPTALNWVYNNHTFTRSAYAATRSTSPPTLLNFVEYTPGSFYYNPTNTTLYVNLGVPITNQVITASVRDPEIYVTFCSNVTFEDLDVTETAHFDANVQLGYGALVFGGANDSIINCDSYLAAKHSFTAEDTTNFLGENLDAIGSAPDLGLGGASGFVFYNDSNTAINGAPNPTSSWINDTYIPTINGTGGGEYEIFISHGSNGNTANILLQNLQAPQGSAGVDIQADDPQETVEVIGGYLTGEGGIGINTNNSYIDGVTLNGQNAAILLTGSNEIVQNCLLYNVVPNPGANQNGAIIDDGTNNTIRFNTVDVGTYWPAVAIENANSNTTLYGNIFIAEFAVWLDFDNSNGSITSDDNIFGPGSNLAQGTAGGGQLKSVTFSQWQAMGHDLDSPQADPQFVDPSNDDFELQAGSPAIDLYRGTPASSIVSVTADLNGNPRPHGAGYDAGAFEFGPADASALDINATVSSMPIQLRIISPTSPLLSPLLGVWEDSSTPGSANPDLTVPLNQISSIAVTAGGQTQQLVVDFSGGAFTVAGGLMFNAAAALSASTVLIGSGQSDAVSLAPNQVTFDTLSIGLAGTSQVALQVNNGTATLAYAATTASAQSPQLSVVDNSAFIVAAGPLGSGVNVVNLAALSLGPGATAAVAAPLDPNDRSLLQSGPLTLAATARLDLNANDMVLHNTSAQQVQTWLASGFANGAWNGPGLISSAAPADPLHLHAIGYLYNQNPYNPSKVIDSQFDGQTVDTTDTLVKYTLYGDADLNGIVNVADYAMIDNGFNTRATGWTNGDFNYDNTINGDDYSLIDNAFNTQAQLSSQHASVAPAEPVAAPSSIVANTASVAAGLPPPARPALLPAASWLAATPPATIFASTQIVAGCWQSLQQLVG